MQITKTHRERKVFSICDSLIHGEQIRASSYVSLSLADGSLATASSIPSSLLIACDDKEGRKNIKNYTT